MGCPFPAIEAARVKLMRGSRDSRLLSEQRRRKILDLIQQGSQVTVLTHALNVAHELADSDVSVIMIGGLLRPVSCSFVGPQAETMLKEFHAHRLFLAVDGFDLEIGPTTPDVLEAELNSLMVRVSREINVVADFSKLGRRSVSRIA